MTVYSDRQRGTQYKPDGRAERDLAHWSVGCPFTSRSSAFAHEHYHKSCALPKRAIAASPRTLESKPYLRAHLLPTSAARPAHLDSLLSSPLLPETASDVRKDKAGEE